MANKLEITSNLFSLTKEQEETSKMMYDGKIIKCLVAPYHTYDVLEKIVPFTKTTYLFPEREMTIGQLSNLISMVVKSPTKDEIRIITGNQNIIMDMVDSSVRVLTEMGTVVPSPRKTFMANIHDIRYELLENESHQISKKAKNEMHERVNKIIDKINSSKSITKAESVPLKVEINMIGEPLIREKLLEMLSDKTR